MASTRHLHIGGFPIRWRARERESSAPVSVHPSIVRIGVRPQSPAARHGDSGETMYVVAAGLRSRDHPASSGLWKAR
jgi:hypothetical protein